jgi:hypothetical protein
MRYFLSTLLVAAVFGSSLAFGQVKSEVSDITGVKRIESKSMRALHDEKYTGSHASFRAEYAKHPDGKTAWIIAFYGFAKDTTEVSRANSFRVQADGQQLEPTRLESKTRNLSNRIIEIKRATFSRSAFERMATAQTVNISIGGAQFTAIKPRRKDMRLILDRVPKGNAPRTASNDSSNSR